MKKLMFLAALVALVGAVHAAVDVPAGTITTSQTWTKANNPYRLNGQVYVTGGATLTIEAGVVVKSLVADQGSLAICRDGMIKVMGTAAEPVIMTSENDDMVTWRSACNEWGNLTIMGNGLISASHYKGTPVTHQDGYSAPVVTNGKLPNGTVKKVMEGLTADAPGDPKVLYGGGDDDDDSGEIHYLSLRYGGKVIGLANELNGLSLGGVGRETEIDHVEIMNNVDDGIEIWGGTVELKYVNIWNVGDDSFDVDQGWRGSAQYGLIVQGYSIDADQGSGVGDNCLEIDGAEEGDAQPVTTARISNFTVVGQPVDGDIATSWRNNARIQYDNCIFLDIGDALVTKEAASKGDATVDYGDAGMLSWADTWTTAAGTRSTVNAGNNAVVYDPYDRQDPSGKLAQITNSVSYNYFTAAGAPYATDYTEADARGFSNPVNNNVKEPATAPIQAIVRGNSWTSSGQGKVMFPVTSITPLPVNGVTAGGFANINWLASWTATDAYGMTDTSMNPANGDVNNDGQVDLTDMSIVSGNWLEGSS